jgi:hypothetical protein
VLEDAKTGLPGWGLAAAATESSGAHTLLTLGPARVCAPFTSLDLGWVDLHERRARGRLVRRVGCAVTGMPMYRPIGFRVHGFSAAVVSAWAISTACAGVMTAPVWDRCGRAARPGHARVARALCRRHRRTRWGAGRRERVGRSRRGAGGSPVAPAGAGHADPPGWLIVQGWWSSAAGARSGRRTPPVRVIGVLVDGVGVPVQRGQAPAWRNAQRAIPLRGRVRVGRVRLRDHNHHTTAHTVPEMAGTASTAASSTSTAAPCLDAGQSAVRSGRGHRSRVPRAHRARARIDSTKASVSALPSFTPTSAPRQ